MTGLQLKVKSDKAKKYLSWMAEADDVSKVIVCGDRDELKDCN